jgi:hypothetical protein
VRGVSKLRPVDQFLGSVEHFYGSREVAEVQMEASFLKGSFDPTDRHRTPRGNLIGICKVFRVQS